MILPPFELHRPHSLEEARELLRRYGEDAAVLCGGTELLLLLKLGFAAYGHLVDVKGIEELGGIRVEDGAVVVGATVTHRALERSPLVRERLPALAAMARGVANIRVRCVGTLGGNLCFADPHSDPTTFLLALDAEAVTGAGRLPIGGFVTGPYETTLEPDDLLRAVRIPLPPAGARLVHRKLAFRERPAVTVTCLVRVEGGRVAEARVAVGSVGPRALRARAAEQALLGAASEDEGALARAGELAAEAAGAVEDANGSVEYKENLVRVLVRRSLAEALAGSR